MNITSNTFSKFLHRNRFTIDTAQPEEYKISSKATYKFRKIGTLNYNFGDLMWTQTKEKKN